MHDVIGKTGDEQAQLVAGECIDGQSSGFRRLAAQVRFRTVVRRKRRGQHIFPFAHVALSLAAFAIMRQHLAPGLFGPVQRRD